MSSIKKYILLLCIPLFIACSPNKTNKEHPNNNICSPKTKLKIEYEDKTLITNCRLSIVKDSAIVFSIYLIGGLEAYRIELLKNKIIVFDRLFYKYTSMNLSKVNIVAKPHIKLKNIQQWALHAEKESVPITYNILGKSITLSLLSACFENNTHKIPQINITNLKKVNMFEMFKY